MSSNAWEEVKRLAADFQRAQLASSLQKLSERNCIEIINKLVQLGLLDVYYTCDGKEYITPAQLSKEILDELYVHGGRINLVDLVTLLNVDLTIIEVKVSELVHSDHHLSLVIGQLMSRQYLDMVAEEVNEQLQQNGSITVATVAKQYDLPGDFVLELLLRRSGTIIQGQQGEHDARTFFTEAFVDRHRARVRGVLSAVTRPTAVSGIISQYEFQERLFFTVAEKLISSGRLSGSISGGRQSTKAVYIPDIYAQSQNEWADNFIKQNGYAEHEALHRIGISDPMTFTQRRYKERGVTTLADVCLTAAFMEALEAAIDDALITTGWVDYGPLLPSSFNSETSSQIVTDILSRRQSQKGSAASMLSGCMVVSSQLLQQLSNELQLQMPAKARQAIETGTLKATNSNNQMKATKLAPTEPEGKSRKKEDRRNRASEGKMGGGAQGRETKTRAVKTKLGPKGGKGGKGGRHSSDSEGEDHEDRSSSSGFKSEGMEFMTTRQLTFEFGKSNELRHCPEELLEALACNLYRPLQQKFLEVCRAVLAENSAARGDSRRKTHLQLQEKVTALATTIRLAEKGIQLFAEDIRVQLSKHLLKTQCTELVNEIVLYLSEGNDRDSLFSTEFTPESRLKMINKFPEEVSESMLAVHRKLAAASVEDFIATAEEAMLAVGVRLPKKDNKRDRQVMASHRAALVEQLSVCDDPPLTLHLACLILFHSCLGNLLEASGKFVPHVVVLLKSELPAPTHGVLVEFQGLVMKSLNAKNQDPIEVGEIRSRLESLTPTLKEMVITFKKGTQKADD